MISSFSAAARHMSARQQHSRQPSRRKGKHHFFSSQLRLMLCYNQAGLGLLNNVFSILRCDC